MPTQSALRSVNPFDDPLRTVARPAELIATGLTEDALRAQLEALRWRRFGRAILLGNGEPTAAERRQLALANAGPGAVFAAFTAAEDLGLRGWEREVVYLLVPAGANVRRLPGIPTRVHYTTQWNPTAIWEHRSVQRIAPAIVLAASTFPRPRPAIGILAAGVQQRLTRPQDLRAALDAAPRLRHRRALLVALDDIEQGAQALSEIDFARLCRRHGLPGPRRQRVRTDRFGRRRYLDAEWVTAGGHVLVVEVDGALHLVAETWWEDQIRQNEVVLSWRPVLRFPSVFVRHEELMVVDQLRRGLAR